MSSATKSKTIQSCLLSKIKKRKFQIYYYNAVTTFINCKPRVARCREGSNQVFSNQTINLLHRGFLFHKCNHNVLALMYTFEHILNCTTTVLLLFYGKLKKYIFLKVKPLKNLSKKILKSM